MEKRKKKETRGGKPYCIWGLYFTVFVRRPICTLPHCICISHPGLATIYLPWKEKRLCMLVSHPFEAYLQVTLFIGPNLKIDFFHLLAPRLDRPTQPGCSAIQGCGGMSDGRMSLRVPLRAWGLRAGGWRAVDKRKCGSSNFGASAVRSQWCTLTVALVLLHSYTPTKYQVCTNTTNCKL